jgi:hypothetical protein
MKLQRTTLILSILALALGGFVYFYEFQWKQNQEIVQLENKKLFNLTKEDIIELTIEKQGQILKFIRTENEFKKWQMQSPEKATANDAVISFLLNLLIEGKSDQSFPISTQQKQDYGLNNPFATISFKTNKPENHTIILGKSNFDKTLIYAQIDPSKKSEEKLTVVLLPLDFQYAVDRQLAEWKNTDIEGKNEG